MADLAAVGFKPTPKVDFDSDRAPGLSGIAAPKVDSQSIFTSRPEKQLTPGLGGEAQDVNAKQAESPCKKLYGQSVNCLDIQG